MHKDYEKVKAGIVTDPKKLSEVCAPVTSIIPEMVVVKELLRAVRILDTNPKLRCCGLAAPQLGYNLRIFVVKNARGMFIPYVNPSITNFGSAWLDSTEGCFSFPGKTKTVKRARTVFVAAEGLECRILRDIPAIAFQHELDHLNGVLI